MDARTTVLLAVLAVCAAPGAYAVEVTFSGTSVSVSAEGVEARGDFHSGEVAFKGGGIELSGAGQLLVVRPDGWVSSLLMGGADRSVGGSDTFGVQLTTKAGPAILALADPEGRAVPVRVPLRALGLTGKAYAAYDFVSNELSGPVVARLAAPLPAGKPAVLALVESTGLPVLVATTDTLAGPASAVSSWDAAKNVLSGTAALAAGKPYELRILAPPVPAAWKADSATLKDGEASAKQTGEWVRLTLSSAKGGPAAWSVSFSRGEAAGVVPAGTLKATAASPRCVMLASSAHGPNIILRRDDGREFAVEEPLFSDSSAKPATTYTYTVESVDWSGKAHAVAAATVTTPERQAPPPPPAVHLADLTPVKATNGWNGDPRKDKSIQDNPLRMRGEEYKRGMGVHAPSELVYEMKPEWKRFVALVGVDDEQAGGSVRFNVLADGKPLISTPVLTPNDERFCVDVEIPAGTKQVSLVVDDGGDGIGCDHADWVNAGFVGGK
jgi:hypothetical protein